MYKACNCYKGTFIQRLTNILVPAHDRQLARPVITLLIFAGSLPLLEAHRCHSIVADPLQIGRQSQELIARYSPFSHVHVKPANAIPVIRGELMVEVMVTFSEGDQGRE